MEENVRIVFNSDGIQTVVKDIKALGGTFDDADASVQTLHEALQGLASVRTGILDSLGVSMEAMDNRVKAAITSVRTLADQVRAVSEANALVGRQSDGFDRMEKNLARVRRGLQGAILDMRSMPREELTRSMSSHRDEYGDNHRGRSEAQIEDLQGAAFGLLNSRGVLAEGQPEFFKRNAAEVTLLDEQLAHIRNSLSAVAAAARSADADMNSPLMQEHYERLASSVDTASRAMASLRAASLADARSAAEAVEAQRRETAAYVDGISDETKAWMLLQQVESRGRLAMNRVAKSRPEPELPAPTRRPYRDRDPLYSQHLAELERERVALLETAKSEWALGRAALAATEALDRQDQAMARLDVSSRVFTNLRALAEDLAEKSRNLGPFLQEKLQGSAQFNALDPDSQGVSGRLGQKMLDASARGSVDPVIARMRVQVTQLKFLMDDLRKSSAAVFSTEWGKDLETRIDKALRRADSQLAAIRDRVSNPLKSVDNKVARRETDVLADVLGGLEKLIVQLAVSGSAIKPRETNADVLAGLKARGNDPREGLRPAASATSAAESAARVASDATAAAAAVDEISAAAESAARPARVLSTEFEELKARLAAANAEMELLREHGLAFSGVKDLFAQIVERVKGIKAAAAEATAAIDVASKNSNVGSRNALAISPLSALQAQVQVLNAARIQLAQANPKILDTAQGRGQLELFDKTIVRLTGRISSLIQIAKDVDKSFNAKSAEAQIAGITTDVEKLALRLANVGAMSGKEFRELAVQLNVLGGGGGGFDDITRRLERLGGAAGRAGGSSHSLLSVLFQFYLVVDMFKQLTDGADKYIERLNKISSWSPNAGNQTAVSEELNRRARDEGVSVGALADAYFKLSAARGATGASQRQTLDMADTLTMVAQIEGAHGNSAAGEGAIEQLVRGLSQAQPQARALLSLLRQYPVLLTEIARRETERTGRTVTPTGLSNEVHNKKLSGQQIFEDIKASQKGIAEEFDRITPTFARGFQVFSDGWDTFLGKTAVGLSLTRGFLAVAKFLAENMEFVAIAAVAAGAAIATAFGGTLVSAFNRVGAAFVAMSEKILAASLANPVLLLVEAVGVAILLIYKFGDQIKLSSDGVVNLKNYAVAAFELVVDWVRSAITWVEKFIAGIDLGPAMSAVRAVLAGVWDFVSSFFHGIGLAVGAAFNGVVGTVRLAATEITDVLAAVGPVLVDVFTNVYNEVAGLVGATLNAVIDGVNAVSHVHLDHVKVKIDNPEAGATERLMRKLGDDAGKAFGTNYAKGVVSAVGGALSGASSAVMARARADAAAQARDGISDVTTPPHPGVNDAHQKGKTPADLIAEERRKLLEAAADAGDFGDDQFDRAAIKSIQDFVRDFQNQFKGAKPPQDVIDEFTRLAVTTDRTKQVQAEYYRIVKEATGPARDYATALEAIDKAMSPQKDYRGTLQPAAVTDPAVEAALRRDALKAELEGRVKFNPEDQESGAGLALISIQEQQAGSARKLETAMEGLYKKYADIKSVETDYHTGMEAIRRDLATHVISANDAAKASRDLNLELAKSRMAQGQPGSGVTAGLTQLGLPGGLNAANDNRDVQATAREAANYAALVKEYDSANQGLKQLQATELALQALMRADPINKGTYGQEFVQARLKVMQLNVELGKTKTATGLISNSFLQLAAGFKGVLPTLSADFNQFFTKFTDGFANSVGEAIVQGKNFGQTMAAVARGALQELIAAIVKMGIQWAVSIATGQAAASAGLAATTAQAVAAGTAWSGPALLASVATLGGADAAGLAALTGAVAAAKAVGAIGAMAGGGPVSGPGGPTSDRILTWLSNGEFVVNARAANDNYGLLHAINSGASVTPVHRASGGFVGTPAYASGGAGGAGAVNVTVENHHPTANIQVERLSSGEVRIIAREEAARAVESRVPHLLEREISNPNSRGSKALQRHIEGGGRRRA